MSKSKYKKPSTAKKVGVWARSIAAVLSTLNSIYSAGAFIGRLVASTAIFAFFLRYWWLLLLVTLAGLLIFSNILFQAVGMLVYLPVLTLGSLAVALLLRNVFNQDTTDADADSGQFVREWRALDARTRVILTVAQMLVYFIGCIYIAAALVK